jgi:hypothetical protein
LAAAAVVVAFGIVMAAGCSSGGGLPVRPSSHATTSATPHRSSGAAAIPVGTQLGALLAGAHLPAGWTHAQGAGNGMANSGSLNTAGDGPPPGQYGCKYVDGSVQAGYIVNWWASSSATMILTYPSAANTPTVNLTIAAYAPGAAAKDMAKAAALIAHCRSFRDPGLDNDRDTTSVTTIPNLGDQNLFLTSREDTSNAGTLTGQLLLIRAGDYILAVSNGVDALRPATVRGFGGWLWQLLEKSKYAS